MVRSIAWAVGESVTSFLWRLEQDVMVLQCGASTAKEFHSKVGSSCCMGRGVRVRARHCHHGIHLACTDYTHPGTDSNHHCKFSSVCFMGLDLVAYEVGTKHFLQLNSHPHCSYGHVYAKRYLNEAEISMADLLYIYI